MLRVCAWCGKTMGYVTGGKPTDIAPSICRACEEKLLAEDRKSKKQRGKRAKA